MISWQVKPFTIQQEFHRSCINSKLRINVAIRELLGPWLDGQLLKSVCWAASKQCIGSKWSLSSEYLWDYRICNPITGSSKLWFGRVLTQWSLDSLPTPKLRCRRVPGITPRQPAWHRGLCASHCSCPNDCPVPNQQFMSGLCNQLCRSHGDGCVMQLQMCFLDITSALSHCFLLFAQLWLAQG